MFNLLKAECRQFVKEKVFKLEIILSVIMTAVMIAISFLEDTNVASTMFSGFIVLGFLYPPMCGSIIFADFKQKTINNKIITGHSRWSICLSKIIVAIALWLIVTTIYTSLFSIVGTLFLGGLDVSWNIFYKNMLVVMMGGLFIVSLAFFFSMAIPNEIGLGIATVTTEVIPMSSMFLMEFLSLNEKYTDLLNWIQAVPITKTMMLTIETAPEHIEYSIIITIISTMTFFFGGFLVFQNKDLP